MNYNEFECTNEFENTTHTVCFGKKLNPAKLNSTFFVLIMFLELIDKFSVSKLSKRIEN